MNKPDGFIILGFAGTALLARSPASVQTFVAHAGRFSDDFVKPLVNQGRAAWPDGFGANYLVDGADAVNSGIGTLKEFAADPSQIVRPIELGPPQGAKTIRIPILHAA